jgi:hypothetical protein
LRIVEWAEATTKKPWEGGIKAKNNSLMLVILILK